MEKAKYDFEESNEMELKPDRIMKVKKFEYKVTKIVQPSLGRSLSMSLSRKKSFRVTDGSVKKVEKNYYKSYAYAIAAAGALGSANYIIEDTSSRLGTKGLFAQSFGLLIAAIQYYIIKYSQWRKANKTPNCTYFNRVTSQYCELFRDEDEEMGLSQPYRDFSCRKILAPLSRTLNEIFI